MSASNEIATFAGEKWLSQTKKTKRTVGKNVEKRIFSIIVRKLKTV